MTGGIRIKLNYQQWIIFRELIAIVIERCPMDNWELESYVIVEVYRRLTYKLTVFEPGSDGNAVISLKFHEAHAIDNFWRCHGTLYNMNIRALIEPKFIPGKPVQLKTQNGYDTTNDFVR